MLRFLVQLVVILLACKALGWLGQRFFGQTQVVMEMIAGVVLGPSLLGLLHPGVQAWLFPQSATYIINGVETTSRHPSMSILYIVAQLGLVLYMFLVGLEFNVGIIRHKARSAVSVSLAGIVAPFLLGVALTAVTFRGFGFFTERIDFNTAALYFGAAMCITAFPMLARILYERGIAGTPMGTLALGAGATDDAVAWSMLAFVLAFAHGTWSYAIFAIGGGVAFAIFVMVLARPWFARLATGVERDGKMSQSVFVSTMILLFMGAYATDAIGIYAVFGAFIIGAAMPRGKFVDEIRIRVESLTVGVLLPFFFVYSGLNTKLSLIDSPALWGIAIVVILCAILGKGVACALAAKANGESWRDSWAIGTLMNARGLMELIILNIGLQQGIITQTFFTIMVMMAIVTTLMASPIFKWIYRSADKSGVGIGTPRTRDQVGGLQEKSAGTL
jgi:Kef-type K+ transport system membrane component KefB